LKYIFLNIEISDFMKKRPVGGVFPCGWADRQTETDMLKLIVAFRNFANVPKNQVLTPTEDALNLH
jgi:hypothetical protein